MVLFSYVLFFLSLFLALSRSLFISADKWACIVYASAIANSCGKLNGHFYSVEKWPIQLSHIASFLENESSHIEMDTLCQRVSRFGYSMVLMAKEMDFQRLAGITKRPEMLEKNNLMAISALKWSNRPMVLSNLVAFSQKSKPEKKPLFISDLWTDPVNVIKWIYLLFLSRFFCSNWIPTPTYNIHIFNNTMSLFILCNCDGDNRKLKKKELEQLWDKNHEQNQLCSRGKKSSVQNYFFLHHKLIEHIFFA